MDFPQIPPVSEPPNWGRIPIAECGEPLVTVAPTEKLGVHALYHELHLPGAAPVLSVREGVYDRLLRAAVALPDGVCLVVFDGYRPLMVQQALYDDFTQEAQKTRPDLEGDALRHYVGQFVANPTADPLRPPPHRTGGAVDVYLVDAQGRQIPMGTLPDEVSEFTATRYFEENPNAPSAEVFGANRRILFWAMTDAGFQNYGGEWWHFDFGNQRWANLTGETALYGIP